MVIDDGKMLQFGRGLDVYDNPNNPIVLGLISHQGINKLNVTVKNGKINPCDIIIYKKEGSYSLYFRTEEIEIAKKGIKAEIQKRFFYNSKKELCECKTEEGDLIQLLVPIKTEDTFQFIYQPNDNWAIFHRGLR